MYTTYKNDKNKEIETVVPDYKIRTLDKDMIMYKAVNRCCRITKGTKGVELLEMLIPAGAKIYAPHTDSTYLAGRKIRVSIAIPLGGWTLIGNGVQKPMMRSEFKIKFDGLLLSQHNNSVEYKIGCPVTPKRAFSMRRQSCASGIHGFFDPEDALKYSFSFMDYLRCF